MAKKPKSKKYMVDHWTPLSEAFKERTAKQVRQTIYGILNDVDEKELNIPRGGIQRKLVLAELTLDANRCQTLGGMCPEDERIICDLYFHHKDPEVRRWVHDMMDY